MMPDVSPVVLEAYESLGPWRRADEGVWDLLYLAEACFGSLQDVEDIVRDTPEREGWANVLDVDVAPEWALSWLAQFNGVIPLFGLDAASQRLRIKNAAGFNRGKVAAIKAAAQQLLTGTRRVDIYERDGSAWRFRVRTYASETPDPDAVKAAIEALKPGGLILTYEVQAGSVIDDLAGTIDAQGTTIDGYSDVVPV